MGLPYFECISLHVVTEPTIASRRNVETCLTNLVGPMLT